MQCCHCTDAAPTRECLAYARRADHPFPLLGLAPSVVCHSLGLPQERWALTPPFHPYPTCAGRYFFCDTFRQLRFASELPPAFLGRIILRCPDFPPSDKLRATALIPIMNIGCFLPLTIPYSYHTQPRVTPSKSMGSKCKAPSTLRQK